VKTVALQAQATVKKVAPGVNPYLEVLNSVPEIAALGPLFKSCAPAEVTESECEYVVTVVKHIFQEHLVFQFNVTNNMENQLLENVTVEMQPEGDAYEEEFSIPEASIAYGAQGSVYVCMSRAAEQFGSGPIANTLKFSFKEVLFDSTTFTL
jgi:coatomer protein complex subunit gamma